MNSIDNSQVLGYNKNNNLFGTAVTFVWDPAAKTFTVTDATAYPAGESRKALQITVFDKFGGKVEDFLGVPGGGNVNNKAVNIAALNPADGLSAIVTLTTVSNKTKDGSIVESFALAGAFVMEK